jgi:hypothetical protein
MNPDELRGRLSLARAAASREVTREKIERLPDDPVQVRRLPRATPDG